MQAIIEAEHEFIYLQDDRLNAKSKLVTTLKEER